MATVIIANPYDPAPISPIANVLDNVAFWSNNHWEVGRLIHIEGIPASPQTTQNLGAISNNGNSGETEITVTDAPTDNLFHLRACVLDPFQADINLPQRTGRHDLDSVRARLTPIIGNHDPNYASTTMFVWGNKRSIWVTGYNESGYDLAQTRIRFWGFRYQLAMYSDAKSKEFTAWMQEFSTKGDPENRRNNPLNEAVTVISSDGR